jgi:hypothetical protein
VAFSVSPHKWHRKLAAAFSPVLHGNSSHKAKTLSADKNKKRLATFAASRFIFNSRFT